MSAFLGPIHFWLYRKVQLQEQLTNTLLGAFSSQQESLKEKMNEEYGVLPTGELDEIIDEGNIHGWLQTQVSRVENRLAYTVAHLATDEASKQVLLSAAFDAGAANKLDVPTPEEAFKALQNVLLDGMPCDRVNELRYSDESRVSWERVNNLHGDYYTAIGADPAMFDEVRDAWINGMLEGTDLSYRRDDMVFSLIKED